MTDDELDDIEGRVAEMRAEMLHCACECGCSHSLFSHLSQLTLRCFMCRGRVHKPEVPAE